MPRATLLLVTAVSAALVGCSGTSTSAAGNTWASVTPHASSTSPKAAGSTSGPEGSTGTLFTSPQGFSLVPPAGWKDLPDRVGGGLSAVFIAPALDPAARFVDNIIVVIDTAHQDLQSTIAQSKLALPGVLTHYRVVIDEPATASGQRAHLLGGTYIRENKAFETLQLVLLARGNQYTVTFTCPAASFESLRGKAQASLLSLHLD
jgi:hypothetical protein